MKNRKIEHIRDLAQNPPVKKYDEKTLIKAVAILLDYYNIDDIGELLNILRAETSLNQNNNEKQEN